MALSTLAHDRAGSGEAVVLIHGIGHRRQAWDPIFHRLARRYDVIALDLAGFGESPGYQDGVDHTMDNACLDLAANFAEWGIDRPHVVGRISRFQAFIPLVLMRLGALLPDRVLRAVSRLLIGRLLIGFLLYSHPGRANAESTYGDSLALKKASAFGKTIRAGIHYTFDAHIAVPTTIAWGTKDRLLPYSQATRARERLPNAHHVPLPDCGHVPMIDNPDLIMQIIEHTILRGRDAQAA